MGDEAQRAVSLAGPLDIPLSLDGLSRWGDDGLDRWDSHVLLRTVPVDAGHAAFAATPTGSIELPAFGVTCAPTAALPTVTAAVNAMFLAPDSNWDELLARDHILRTLDARYPGCRPLRYFDLYGMLVRSISAQQVNLTWAATTRRRLAERFGTLHRVAGHKVYSLDPERLAGVPVAALRELQFTTRKAEYIVGTARAIVDGVIDARALQAMDDREVERTLVAVRGIGLWTAEWMLVRYLGRARVVAGDLGVRKAVGRAYLSDPLPSEDAVRRATAHWGENAAVAQHLLLHALSAGEL
jgi:DNA-3-methyladenine glycosylase II